MSAKAKPGFTPGESVWTWDGYRICKRLRKAVEKDQRGVGRIHAFTDSVFESELEAVECAYKSSISDRDKAEREYQQAQKRFVKMWKRRAAVRAVIAAV